MGKITVERNNCDRGYWELPDGAKVSLAGMAEYYISEREGTLTTLDDLKSLSYRFVYSDPALEAGNGEDNVPGRVEIVYKRKG